MMTSNKKELCISWNVAVSLPIPEDMGKLQEGDIILVLPVDPIKYRSKNELTLDSRFRRKLTSNEITYRKKLIRNSGFSIELYDRQVKFPKSYIPVSLVRLHHPDLDSLPVPVVTYIQSLDLLDIIKEVGYVSEGKIHGSLCCSHEASFSGLWSTSFVLEDPENTKLSDDKEIGKLLETSKKTTKWKPGSIYVLPSRHVVLYLGVLPERPETTSYYTRMSGIELVTSIRGNFGSKKLIPNLQSHHLFLNITDNEKLLIEQMKGKRITEFVQSYLTSFSEYRNLKFYSGFIQKGAALKESDYLQDDSNPGLDDTITRYFSNNIVGKEDYTGAVLYSKLSEEGKSWADSWIKNCISEWANDMGRYSGRYSSKPPTSQELLLELSKGSRWYNKGLDNIQVWAGEENFKRLAIEQLG